VDKVENLNLSLYSMKNIKGPAIFLAQFMGDKAPFNNLKSICKWAASLGYVGVHDTDMGSPVH